VHQGIRFPSRNLSDNEDIFLSQTVSPASSGSIRLRIDHVTIAGSSLDQLEAAFSAAGLTPDYGGAHSNGITHMSLLGFDDGSYIELISSLESGAKDPDFWGEHINGNGGPCAWAVLVEDIEAEAKRIAALDVTVVGPHYKNRSRPDGMLVEWQLAFLGDKGAGATLPFVIKDITPRRIRVQPSASVAGSPQQPALLTGIRAVILGVGSLTTTTDLFQRVYNWAVPQVADQPDFGASLAQFSQTPVIVASPLADHGWLGERLARFDDSPCGFLIGTNEFQAACRRYDLVQQSEWFGQPVAWFEPDRLSGVRLGIMGS
jgi:hypothetical protein